MRILISSGIYPPDIGGPAQYARNLYETWKSQGHDVKVAAYRWERAFPSFLRHILFFLKIIRKGWKADMILVLDTWSAAVPTMYACRFMRKKYIIRTGGDALWESYVERTKDMVLFRNFYDTSIQKISFKERLMYRLGGASLRGADKVIFSTEWQRSIFERVYKLDKDSSFVVTNFCGERFDFIEPENRTFIASTRSSYWKNTASLEEIFKLAKEEVKRSGLPDISLDMSRAMYDNFLEKMRRSYATILISIGDISPNMILDSIRVGTPFIVTEENGIKDIIDKGAIYVDPLNKEQIIEKIVWLSDPNNRKIQAEKVQSIDFIHTWSEIANEIMDIWNKKIKS